MLPLHTALQGRVVVVGIGNPQRGDDRAGPRVARLVKRLLLAPGQGAGRICASIDADTVPEAVVGKVAACHPDTILLIDAVDLGAAPGALVLLSEGDLTAHWSPPADPGPTTRTAGGTHRSPLALLMQYLAQRTGAHVWLLGIQAADTGWFASMTPPVRAATRQIFHLLREMHGDACALPGPVDHWHDRR